MKMRKRKGEKGGRGGGRENEREIDKKTIENKVKRERRKRIFLIRLRNRIIHSSTS